MSERGEARGVLASVVAMILVVALVQISAWLFASPPSAYGQSQAQPTTGFTIQFLNPSAGTSNELSTKNDGRDQLYHFVAWVNRVPENAIVEFKYQEEGSNTEVSLGQGTQVGTDTFELFDDLAGVTGEGTNSPATGDPENTGVVRAILYSGNAEMARDEEEVRVNQQVAPECPSEDNPPPCHEESQANTVELTYPTNGGLLGFYRPNPGNGPVNSVFDVSVSTATQGETGTGTLEVTSYYTLSSSGTEPQWKPCQAGTRDAAETTAQSADGVRCEYAAEDNPGSVTAVAVVANDEGEAVAGASADTDSADAHRVGLYEQDATSVSLNPQTTSQGVNASNQFPCSPVTTMTVTDQTGRKIADMNVDVHATGPADNLSFDDASGTDTSPNKAPENHASEGTADCEATAPAPGNGSSSQGDHELPNEGDIKHIESLNDTDDAGQFRFRFHSPVSGGTQYTVFADEDSNDRLCSQEPQADGSVGWGQDAPGPTGLPDEDTSCPRPGPTGSPTPSPSGTASPRPSGTGTQAPQQSRSITLAASGNRASAGETVTLAGQIFSNDESCEDDEFVRITRRVHGRRSASELTTARTNANGRYEVTLKVTKSAEYQAVSPAHDNCADAFSSPVNIVVHPNVGLSASDKSAQRGSVVRFRVKVSPKHAGTKVVLQRKKGGRFVKVDSAKLNRRSVAVFRVKMNWFGRRDFRARWRSQDDDHSTGTSQRVTVRSR